MFIDTTATLSISFARAKLKQFRSREKAVNEIVFYKHLAPMERKPVS
ncbi:MAG: hypothetical protein QOF62_3560 [Pyrinomonadaceae bacterium]|jgi:hypothetical protein|nr:hypothetical protein [Pyrinomonadaceae bacterium]